MTHANTQAETRPLTLIGDWQGLPTPNSLTAGTHMGPYQLVKELGRGGMGQVWLAQQHAPVERKVAIKLQSDHLGEGLARAYFLVERQAMAQMVHPYIAQLYDAGTLPDGALFFAMEYIEGITLDAWLMRPSRSIGEFLALLIKVCDAMSYAHQRGLLHRDLKPWNILVVALADGVDIPKVIDFGLALGLDAESGFARDGHSAGTRAFMSPEQIDPPESGLDVRVDVFALGVILAAGLRFLCDRSVTAFQTSSAHLRTTFQTLPARARDGHAAERSVTHRLPKELRVIVLKAMAADRDQRYASTAALADELRRYLAGQPVQAMTGGRGYALRCFLRRNRLRVALVSLASVALVVGFAAATYGLLQAQEQRALAEARRANAESLLGFMLGDLTDKLRPIGRLELLESVSKEAMTYLSQDDSRNDDADTLIKKAKTLRTLAEVEQARGQAGAAQSVVDRAEALLDRAAPLSQTSPDFWFERGQVAYWNGAIAYAARDLPVAEKHWLRYRDAAAGLGRLSPDRVATQEQSYAQNNLAVVAFEQGRFAEAAVGFQETVDLRTLLDDGSSESNGSLSKALSWLARSHAQDRRLGDARAAYKKQLALVVRARREDPESTELRYEEILARHWVGRIALDMGELGDAVDQLRQVVGAADNLIKVDGSQAVWRRAAISGLLDLSIALGAQNEVEEARACLKSALAAIEADSDDGIQLLRTRALWLLWETQPQTADGLALLREISVPSSDQWLAQTRRAIVSFLTRKKSELSETQAAQLLDTGKFSEINPATASLAELSYYYAYSLWVGRDTDAARYRAILDRAGYAHPEYLMLKDAKFLPRRKP